MRAMQGCFNHGVYNLASSHAQDRRLYCIPIRNKFCFTGGYIESRVMLPGFSNVAGLWPAIWTMGNLGRAGYGATTDGMVRIAYRSSVICILI